MTETPIPSNRGDEARTGAAADGRNKKQPPVVEPRVIHVPDPHGSRRRPRATVITRSSKPPRRPSDRGRGVFRPPVRAIGMLLSQYYWIQPLEKYARVVLSEQSRRSPAKTIGNTMATGTVKWFNSQKGFGFVQPDEGGTDVFVHISAVERAGMHGLNEGDKISYDIVADKRSGKSSADNLKKA